MRFLNKIILINSANVKYNEILLDGNVHFIGTQGAGKTTLLRPILFFYNADTQGLGIPPGKMPYSDYYFNKPNAYIIYEVARDDNKFCVVSYKSQRRVVFRFFDGEYKREYFVSESGEVPSSWDGIAVKLDEARVFYTKRKVEEHKEYRNIIYGNHDGKRSDLKKYSLLESRDYLYVPKTIQNVFLNSKMDAEFIKQTIIMSLENDIRINLNNYLHHLKDFETQLADIRKFKLPSTIAQARSIAELNFRIKILQNEKRSLAGELSLVLQQNSKEEPKLKTAHDKGTANKTKLQSSINELDSAFKSAKQDLDSKISVLKRDIELTGQKAEYYEKIGIETIIERVSKKEQITKTQEKLQAEDTLLRSQFQEISQRFKSLLDNVHLNWNTYLNEYNSRVNAAESDFLRFKEAQRVKTDNWIKELRLAYKGRMQSANEEWEAQKSSVADLRVKLEAAKHAQLYEAEISGLRNSIKEHQQAIEKATLENGNLSSQVKNNQKAWELEEREIRSQAQKEIESVISKTDLITTRLIEIGEYIQNSTNSFYGWLSDHYPGWEETIGKVVDEKHILFNENLLPKLKEIGGSLYGVEVDLRDIKKKVKTVADYEFERDELNVRIQENDKAVSDIKGNLDNKLDSVKIKFSKLIRQSNETIKVNDYIITITQPKHDEAKLEHGKLLKRAADEKQLAIQAIQKTIAESGQLVTEAHDKVKALENQIDNEILTKEAEYSEFIKEQEQRKSQTLKNLSDERAIKEKEKEKRIDEIKKTEGDELASKGADSKRLSEINRLFKENKAELDFIESNRDTVSEYNKDKREYFDRLNEFIFQRDKLDQQLSDLGKKHTQKREELLVELAMINDTLAAIEVDLKKIKEDSDAFMNFESSDCHKSIQMDMTSINVNARSDKRAVAIIDQIKSIHYEKLNECFDTLRSTVTDFLGKFSDANVFKFNKQLTDNNSFLSFAEMLSDFVEENKIEKIEREVNERFALIIRTIGTETTDLVSAGGKIQKVVADVNRDFLKKDFAGVIKRIELKVDESKNEVVQLLLLIKKFNDDNSAQLGSPNLFSSDEHDKRNKEAIDLLKQFVKKIAELKRDYISLSDSFELKFRIEENLNDTGWVEKLSNVGSDGTDVLVKAILNIMLLNVFKEGASKHFKDFQLHCMMDEIGKLHPTNVRGIIRFANERNIILINSSPIENDALAFKHIYKLRKDDTGITRTNRILSQYSN